jgi:pimeloyl-ACP methyl ester carboxylesterase
MGPLVARLRRLGPLSLALLGLLVTGPLTAGSETPEVEHRYVTHDDVRLHYVAAGEGPLVVLIHGFPDFWRTWTGLIEQLRENYRVVALDCRGYNLSDQPEGVEHYTLELLAGDVAALIAAEGAESATIVGHDWGAAIAWQFALRYPQQTGGLVVLSVPHPVLFAEQLGSNPRQQASSQYARDFQQPGSEQRLTAEGLAAWVKSPSERAIYVEAFERSSFSAMMNYYRANYPSGATQRPADGAAGQPAGLIDAPVLIIHGVQDTALMAEGHDGSWRHIARDSTLLMIPSAGHFVHHDAPQLVLGTIRQWLDLRQPR